jgi:hypothetical protein
MNRELRQSNIELIRIVAIIFIIAHHLLVHGMHIWDDVSWDNFPFVFSDAVFFISVNLFVLISGYCGIKFRWRKFFYIWLLCALVGGLAYFFHLFVDDARIGKSFVKNTLFSISNVHGIWYVQIYVFLMLLSPLINTALNNMTKNQVLYLIAALTIISSYFGWFWGHEVNKDGYNLINFIWLYIIGYFLRNYWKIDRYKPYLYLFISVVCSIMHSALFLSCREYVAWAYNNPFVIVSSVAFFLFMISFKFKSLWINRIAASTLVVYLVHENSYVSPWLYGSQFSSVYSQNIIYFVLAVFAIYFCCVIIDFLLRGLVANNVLKYVYPLLRNSGKRIFLTIKNK